MIIIKEEYSMFKVVVSSLFLCSLSLFCEQRIQFEQAGVLVSAPKAYAEEIKENVLPKFDYILLTETNTWMFNALTEINQKLVNSNRVMVSDATQCLNQVFAKFNVTIESDRLLREIAAIRERELKSYLNKKLVIDFRAIDEVTNYHIPIKLKENVLQYCYNQTWKQKVNDPNIVVVLPLDYLDKNGAVLNTHLYNSIVSRSTVESSIFMELSALVNNGLKQVGITFEDELITQIFCDVFYTKIASEICNKSGFETLYNRFADAAHNPGLLRVDEYSAMMNLISFSSEHKDKFETRPLQEIFCSVNRSMGSVVLYKNIAYLSSAELQEFIATLKKLPQPVKTNDFISAFNKFTGAELNKELCSFAQRKALEYRRKYYRERGIFSQDDPVQCESLITTTIHNGNILFSYPESFSLKEFRVGEKAAISYYQRLKSILDDLAQNRDVTTVSQKDLALIKSITGIKQKHNYLANYEDFSNEIHNKIMDLIFTESGQLKFSIFEWKDLAKRFTYGEKISGISYSSSDTFRYNGGYAVNGGEYEFMNNEKPTQYGVIGIQKNKYELYSEEDLLMINHSMVFGMDSLFSLYISVHEVVERSVVDGYINTDDCRWFHDGLANFVASKVCESKARREVNYAEFWPSLNPTESCKITADDLLNWRLKLRSDREIEQAETVALYYFSELIFKEIEKDFDSKFIVNWLIKLKSAGDQTDSRKMINQAFYDLSNQSLKTYIEGVIKKVKKEAR